MEDFNNIEKHFKGLSETDSPVPPQEIWENISSDLKQHKSKNRMVWIFLIPLLVLVGMGLFVNQIQSGELEKLTKETIELSSKSNDKASTKSFLSNKNEDFKIDEKLDNLKKSNPEVKGINNSQYQGYSNDDKIRGLQNAKPDHNLKSKSKVLSKAIKAYEDLSVKTAAAVQVQTSSEKKEILNFKSDLLENIPDRNLGFEADKINDGTVLIDVSNETASLQNEMKDLIQVSMIKPIPDVYKSENGRIKLLQMESRNIPEFTSQMIEPLRNAKAHFFINLSLNAGIHNTGLSLKDLEKEDYRSPNETNWYTWGSKIDLGYRFSNHLYMTTGISFFQSKDKFSVSKTNSINWDADSSTMVIRTKKIRNPS